jgi:beta-galactosidase beta subunit
MASMAPKGKQKYIDLQHVNTGFEPRGGKHWHQKKISFSKRNQEDLTFYNSWNSHFVKVALFN